MKQILILLICFAALSCSKDETETMSLNNEEEILNAIEGEWQYYEFWRPKYDTCYYSDVRSSDQEILEEIIRFKKDRTYQIGNSTGKVYLTSHFTLENIEKKLLRFEGWDFYFYLIAYDDWADENYTALVGVKEIFIEGIDNDFLTIRCDQLNESGQYTLPAYIKFKRVK